MFIRKFIGCALALGLAAIAGCNRGPGRITAPPINASAAGSKAVEMYDADKDGKISGEELNACGALKSALSKIDKTSSGAVTADQITARIKEWQASRLGRMSVSCSVTRNGKPLPGALVKFVPEKFLGDNVPAAEGKTDASGTAMISIPIKAGDRREPPGVAPGLYRVEITKDGDNVPSKYNASTILGQEVANDANGMQEGIRFDLKY